MPHKQSRRIPSWLDPVPTIPKSPVGVESHAQTSTICLMMTLMIVMTMVLEMLMVVMLHGDQDQDCLLYTSDAADE